MTGLGLKPPIQSSAESTSIDVVPSADSKNKPVESVSPVDPIPNPGTDKILETNKTEYLPGEELEVSFKLDARTSFDETAWAGIIPAEVPHGNEETNDDFDLAYAFLGNHQEGILVFEAPDQAGAYEVRLFSSDEGGGQEVAAIPFKVIGPITPVSGNQIRLNKSLFSPGETIQLEVSIKPEDKWDESAWVGIVPWDVPHGSEAVNDANNLGYQYMGPYLAGKMRFPAPLQPGTYDMRLNSSDEAGQELVFATFLVK